MENYLEIETFTKRIFNSMRHEVEGVLKKKLSGSEYRILNLIANQVTKTSDLAKLLDVSASHITAITDALVENDFITRSRSTKDRRIIELSLTEAGQAFVADIEKQKRAIMMKHFSVFTPEEETEFKRLLKKLAEAPLD